MQTSDPMLLKVLELTGEENAHKAKLEGVQPIPLVVLLTVSRFVGCVSFQDAEESLPSVYCFLEEILHDFLVGLWIESLWTH